MDPDAFASVMDAQTTWVRPRRVRLAASASPSLYVPRASKHGPPSAASIYQRRAKAKTHSFGGGAQRFQSTRDMERKERALPGPAEYKPPSSTEAMPGGRFSLARPKSEIEWCEYRGRQTPGPGAHDPNPAARRANNAGGFSLAQPKSDVEWQMHRAAKTPGPAEYTHAGLGEDIRGGVLSVADPKTDVDWAVYRAARQPCPGSYSHAATELGSGIKGGRFNTGNSKTDVDWAVYRARAIPASADTGHDGVLLQSKRINGGRFSTANPKDAIDWAVYDAKSKPAPGSHEISRQLRAWQSHNSVDRGQLRVARKKLMRHRRAAKPKARKAKTKAKGAHGGNEQCSHRAARRRVDADARVIVRPRADDARLRR